MQNKPVALVAGASKSAVFRTGIIVLEHVF